MAKTNAQRYQEHAARKQKQGFIRRTYWLPKQEENKVRSFINQLCEKYK